MKVVYRDLKDYSDKDLKRVINYYKAMALEGMKALSERLNYLKDEKHAMDVIQDLALAAENLKNCLEQVEPKKKAE